MKSLKKKPQRSPAKINKFLILGIIFIVAVGLIAYFNLGKTTTLITPANKTVKKNITPIEAAKQFNAQNALDFARDVCDIGPRCNGNPGELKAADLMEAELRKYGLNVTKERVDLGGGKYTYNVIGKIEGSTDPNHYIIIGSHIDSPTLTMVGATDDAAAMGIQVEMARILANASTKKTILIIGFGGEELWFKGSEDFVKKHPDIIKNCEAMIDLNCVGAGEYVTPVSSSSIPETVAADPHLLELLEQSANELGIPLSISAESYPSDTYYFYKSNVPVVLIESAPFKVAPWSEENTIDKLEFDDMRKIGEVVIMTTLKLSNPGP